MAKKDQVEDMEVEVVSDEVHPNQADNLPTIDPETGKPTTYGELRNPSPVEETEQDSEPLQNNE